MDPYCANHLYLYVRVCGVGTVLKATGVYSNKVRNDDKWYIVACLSTWSCKEPTIILGEVWSLFLSVP